MMIQKNSPSAWKRFLYDIQRTASDLDNTKSKVYDKQASILLKIEINMFKTFTKYFSLCVFITCSISSVHASDDKSKKNDPPPETTSKKKIPPLPRHAFFPKIKYSRAPDIAGEFEIDFSKRKFWIIAFIASWNQRSTNINIKFNQKIKEFNQRNIGTLALFSQNTEEDVEAWREKNKPQFENFYAARDFVDTLNNPKIPTLWLLGNQGEILLKQELPTNHQIDSVIEKVLVLTGF